MQVFKAILEGWAWSMIGATVLWFAMPDSPDDGWLFNNQFASRWEGGCGGWTNSLAMAHVIGDLLTWTAYVTIGIVMLRLHPIIRRLKTARITVSLIVTVFVTCGATHLLDAYATFNPIYVATGMFKNIAAVVGLFGAVFVAHNLVTAFAQHETDRKRLSELEEREKGR